MVKGETCAECATSAPCLLYLLATGDQPTLLCDGCTSRLWAGITTPIPVPEDKDFFDPWPPPLPERAPSTDSLRALTHAWSHKHWLVNRKRGEIYQFREWPLPVGGKSMDEWVDVRNTTPLLIPYVDERTGEIVEIREEVVPVTRNQLPSPVLFLPEDAIVLAVVERRVKAGQVFLICLGRHVRDPQRRAKRVFAFADQPFILSIQAPGDASKSTTQLGRLEGTLRTWYRKHLLGQRVRGYEAVGRKRMNTDDDYIRARKLALSDIETAIRAYYDQTEQTQGRKWDLLQVWMNKYLPRPVSRYTIRLRLTQLMRKGKVPLG